MRNPNGYGSIYKLSGKRRKPWIVRKTVNLTIDEETCKAKQEYETIGYYATRPEAIKALADYNENPYSIEVSTVTFAEMYKKWSNERFNKLSDSSIKGHKTAYKILGPIHDLKFVEIKKSHMQNVIDTCGKKFDMLRKVKLLLNQLFNFAIENDIVNKNYATFVEIGEKEEETDRKPFTQKEIDLLWENLCRMEFIDTILIMIYSGLRPGELILIENKNLDIDRRTMKGGIKTKASKNRIIPINRKILPLIKNRMSSDNDFLIINDKGKQMSYYTYYDCHFKKIMEQLNMNHKPHDCRHTFATLMDNAEANKLCIKRIMGHASQDITDQVYTHKDIEELLKAVDLI